MTKREQNDIEAIKRVLRPIYITATWGDEGWSNHDELMVRDLDRVLVGIRGAFALPVDHDCFKWWMANEYRNINSAAEWLHGCGVRAPKQ